MSAPFLHHLRVRYHECDAQGIVFNANWLTYVGVATTELWRAALGSYAALSELGVDVVVADATLRFRRPARFDDQLELALTVTDQPDTELHLRAEARRDGELLVVATLRYVVVDSETLRRAAAPEAVRAALATWQPAAS